MMKNKKRPVFILTAMIMVSLLSACQKNDSDIAKEDMAPFTPPTDFQWEGTYIDSVNELAVLSIELADNGFFCTISVPDKDITNIQSYEFTAKPAEDGLGLEYTAGSHTSYLLPPAENMSNGVTTTEVYSDGTGRIYYLDGNVFWMDEKDNAGSGFIFERVEEETAAAESTGE